MDAYEKKPHIYTTKFVTPYICLCMYILDNIKVHVKKKK